MVKHFCVRCSYILLYPIIIIGMLIICLPQSFDAYIQNFTCYDAFESGKNVCFRLIFVSFNQRASIRFSWFSPFVNWAKKLCIRSAIQLKHFKCVTTTLLRISLVHYDLQLEKYNLFAFFCLFCIFFFFFFFFSI